MHNQHRNGIAHGWPNERLLACAVDQLPIPLMRSRTSRSDDPGPRRPRLDLGVSRSRLARGTWHQTPRLNLGRAWPGTQSERTLALSGIVVRIRAVVVASTVVLCGLVTPDLAFAQTNKNKTPLAAAQLSSTKPKIIPGSDPGGIAVAIIGTGVNYTLRQFADRLARDGEGDIIGLDFVDRDNRPFDTGPDLPTAPGGLSPLGTTPASVVLLEAPQARLVPVRIRLGDPRAFAASVAFVASTPARIVVVAFTNGARADWEPFEQAAKAAPNVLFILPAGDSGQDLDETPLFPASLGLANALVVTAGARERGAPPAPDANFGVATVDVEVSTGDVPALAIDGTPVKATGSVYAAARLAAWAARLLQADRSQSVAQLKSRLVALAKPQATPQRRSRSGPIASPFGGWPIAPKP